MHTQLSPCDDLKGRQLLQFLQLLGVLQVLQILAILRGRRRGRGGLFFLGHGGAEAWESEREERRWVWAKAWRQSPKQLSAAKSAWG